MGIQDTASVCVLFFSSPGGLEEERRAFRETVHELTDCEALRSRLIFLPMGWEHVAPGVGRPQERINDHLAKAHVLLLVLHDRWGSASGGSGYSSGTVEELAVAMALLADPQTPMREIVVLLRDIDTRQQRDPGPQLQRVLSFRAVLDECHELQYGTFATIDEFKRQLRRLLHDWTAALKEGWPKAAISLPHLTKWVSTQRAEVSAVPQPRDTSEVPASKAGRGYRIELGARSRASDPPLGPLPLSRVAPLDRLGHTHSWRLAALSAALALVVLGSVHYRQLQELQRAQISLPILELLPSGEISRGPDQTNHFHVSAKAERVMLEPVVVDVPAYRTYRVAVTAGRRTVVSSSELSREELYDFNVILPCSRLPAGPLALLIYGSNDGKGELVQRFDATIAYGER